MLVPVLLDSLRKMSDGVMVLLGPSRFIGRSVTSYYGAEVFVSMD